MSDRNIRGIDKTVDATSDADKKLVTASKVGSDKRALDISVLDSSFMRAEIVPLLEQIIIETRKTNYHLQLFTDSKITDNEVEEWGP